MKKEDLQKILRLHGVWVRGDGGVCANLSGANLIGAILSDAILSGANLSGAILSDADLSGANLSDANLSCADLSCANLSGADLRGADLSGADLRVANLIDANLSGASLSDAILSDANLSGANLWSTIGNGREIRSIHCGTYNIAFTRDVMQIGCKRFLVAEWFSFDDKAIASMDVGALDFWRVWKPILQQIVEASK